MRTQLGSLQLPAASSRLATSLLAWYRRTRRDLPWREVPDPYRVWLSEVMLQQTRVETVVPYYLRFLERFPTLEVLATAREDEVLALWSGLGYYRRARLLREGARQVVEEHGGRFPDEIEEALRIPGVGPYTAAAVISIAYNRPHPVVDGNVERVVTRLLRLAGNPRRQEAARRLRELLASWMPSGQARDFNQAVMEMGAMVCTPVAPRCSSCPLRDSCEARRHGDAERFPEMPARRETVALDLEVGILESRGRYLLERESRFSFLEGLWLFPLEAKPSADRGELSREGVSRALSSRLGVEVRESGGMKPLRHAITFRRITLWPKILESPRPDLRGRKCFRWARLADLGRTVPVSSICLKLARLL